MHIREKPDREEIIDLAAVSKMALILKIQASRI
jgi:hypothetical protein